MGPTEVTRQHNFLSLFLSLAWPFFFRSLLYFVLFFFLPLIPLSFFIYFLLFIFVSFSPTRSLILLCLFVCFFFFSSFSLFLLLLLLFFFWPLLHTVFFHCCCVVGCVNLICGKVVLSLVEPVRPIFGLFIYLFLPFICIIVTQIV